MFSSVTAQLVVVELKADCSDVEVMDYNYTCTSATASDRGGIRVQHVGDRRSSVVMDSRWTAAEG